MGYKNFIPIFRGRNPQNSDYSAQKIKWSKICLIFTIMTWFMYFIRSCVYIITPFIANIQSDSACNVEIKLKNISYRLSSSFLYCLIISRLRMAYVNTKFSYSLHQVILPLYFVVFAFTCGFGVGDYIFLKNYWSYDRKVCVAEFPAGGIIITILYELSFGIICILLFIAPLKKMQAEFNKSNISVMKSTFTKLSQFTIRKYTTLIILVTLGTTLLFLLALLLFGKLYSFI